jgi:zinc ribbon protein
MSSETSTDSLQPWQLFTLAGLIGATVVVFVSRGQTPAGVVLLSLTIFAAAVVGLAAWRTFAPFAGRDEPAGPQMIGGRTRAALDREKTLVLRSIKELEFDRAMGKVSDRDFAEMGARLRARAAGLMRQLDADGGYREQIEKEIAQRVGRTLSGSPGAPDKARPTILICSTCNTANDADARFCKECGAKLEKTV